jgi:hypothetical protein
MQPALIYTLEEAVRKLRGTLYEIAVGLNANIASLSQTCEIAFKKYDLSNTRSSNFPSVGAGGFFKEPAGVHHAFGGCAVAHDEAAKVKVRKPVHVRDAERLEKLVHHPQRTLVFWHGH